MKMQLINIFLVCSSIAKKQSHRIAFFALNWLAIGILFSISAHAENPTIVGWSEKVLLFPGNIESTAKMDTGARTSSIHAPEITIYQKNNENWVKFIFYNKKGQNVKIDRPIVRTAQIKDLTGPAQQRPVIMLGVCLGSLYHETEFTLFDRKGFNFRILLGRRFLQKANILVNSQLKRLLKPACQNISNL